MSKPIAIDAYEASAVRDCVSAAEWATRVDLAACYRLMSHYGVQDLTYNHISARIPGEPDHLLINPRDMMFGEITASSLLKYDLDGTPLLGTDKPLGTAYMVLHAKVLAARPDIHAIAHTHTVANMAVSTYPEGLLPLSQHSLMFYGKIAYHPFQGLEFESEMAERIIRDVGDLRVALLRNHGAYVLAESVAELFVVHQFLETACRAQVAALSMTPNPILVPREVCEYAARQHHQLGGPKNGGKDWGACMRLVERLYPDFKL
jgi:ribulose-5-phosphate 4-epimerase/fuculose-1-phosphate aldolase